MENLLADLYIQSRIFKLISENFAKYGNDKFVDWLRNELLLDDGVYNKKVWIRKIKTIKKMNAEELDQERVRLDHWFEIWRRQCASLLAVWSYCWNNSKSRRNRWSRYEPWKADSCKILDRLIKSVQEYRKKYYTNAEDVPQNMTLQQDSLLYWRLFYCWFYSSEKFDCDADSTIERLERSREARSEASDETNTLEEITLLDAMTTEWKRGETRAMQYFVQKYGGILVKYVRENWSRQVPKSFVKLEECDWWGNIYDILVGIKDDKPLSYDKPLSLGYRGDGSLKNWLYLAIRSYFTSEQLQKEKKPDGEVQWRSRLPKSFDPTNFEIASDNKLSPDFMLILDEVRTVLEEIWKNSNRNEQLVLQYAVEKYWREVWKNAEKKVKKDEEEQAEKTDKQCKSDKERRHEFLQKFVRETERELLKILGGSRMSKIRKKFLPKLVKKLKSVLPDELTPEEKVALGKTIVDEIGRLSQRYPCCSSKTGTSLKITL